jgi:hypothetical protein
LNYYNVRAVLAQGFAMVVDTVDESDEWLVLGYLL